MGAFRLIIYIIGAGAVIVVTYAFFWAIGWFNAQYSPINVEVVTYASLVWLMSGILAGLIVFAAIVKDHSKLEILSSASFLIYTILAYSIGCTILSFFIPYKGFGVLNVDVIVTIGGSGINTIAANILFANILTAVLIVVLQTLRFLKTLVKAMKTTKEVQDTRKK